MKVRIGVGAGGAGLEPATLHDLLAGIDELGLDSLWLPELLTADGPDPLVALAWAAAANPRVKVGTTMLLPGRNPLRLAKAVATLDVLSAGRFLVTFVPGLARGLERQAVGLAPAERLAEMEEVMPVLRQLWDGGPVTHHGRYADLAGVVLSPLPVQDPFEAWLGGLRRSSLVLCGRLFDGWLPAFCTPDEAAEGRQVVDQAAEDAGRAISPEHFGASLLMAASPPEDHVVEALRSRAGGRAVEDLVPVGWPALRATLERFIEVGFSKFVVRPLAPPANWRAWLEGLSEAVGDLQG